MSRPAQLEEQVALVKKIQEEMANPQEQVIDPQVQDPGTPQNDPPNAPVSQEPATVTKEEYDRLEQRYRTLQGMHKADTQQLRAELSEALVSFDAFKAQVAAQQQQQPAPGPKKYTTDEDVTEFGEDTLDMVRRAAREEAEAISLQRESGFVSRIQELQSELDKLRGIVPTVQGMAYRNEEQRREKFWETIDTQVPDWRTVNDNPSFKDWLLSEDELTGYPRQQFLSQAQAEYDALRVVKFFNEWKRKAAGGQTPAPVTPQNSLQQYVSPGPARTNQPTEAKKKQWTREGISEFYKEAMLGKYKDKPEEKKRIEAEISLAAREGRVN